MILVLLSKGTHNTEYGDVFIRCRVKYGLLPASMGFEFGARAAGQGDSHAVIAIVVSSSQS